MSRINKKFLAYILVVIVPVAFLFLNQNNLKSFKMRIVESTFSPIEVALFPFLEIKKMALYRVTYNQFLKLKKENDALRGRLLTQEEALKENKRLKTLLDLKENLKYQTVAAKVIGRDPSNWNAAVIIDKGERDGLKQGMAVMTASSVVGKILETGKKSSKVVLLNDANFSVAALLERTREAGLVSGTLRGLCRMRYLSLNADIVEGDVIVTSALSSSFPEGLLVGKVIRSEENRDSPMKECLVLPAAQPSQLEEVLIIKK